MGDLSPLLQVREVIFVREGKTLLAPVSFDLHQGEFLWLTGPSGAGKSTLLKIIASLLEPSGGEVRFKGQPISELTPEAYRQRVSYVFQTPQLFGRTVYDNLSLPYQIRQQPVNRQHLAAELQRVGLSPDMLDKPVEQLSGGEKQRVALLRNLQFPPDILLLDEISSALDEANKQKVQQLIDRLVATGTAAIWISHDSVEMDDGRRRITLLPGGQESQHESA
ncbi:iron efflux ABC transporter ATP-binding subunit FetA [Erwinia sorbitola]|uniref:ATP-binding cassette domain-containing protein n=1 Tax=Erwinia sorbitola TaxID=2681984 RepID=A0ABW9RA42_9GAMM|nr:ATP-binding cassette domain-containing protein [Erwinia sorbitola]MTD26886.1 ATP-binding cassette domain-containing protein [Erwinia sorbitola]